MVSLSDSQVERIHDILLDFGVNYDPLRFDLLDHVCCMVENKMERGENFDQSLHNSISNFGRDEFARTQESTLYLITLKLRKMKKVTGILGVITALMVLIGVVFKVMHWPGANIMLVMGVALIGLIVLPMMGFLSMKEGQGQYFTASTLLGYTSAALATLGTLFKVMHWPGAQILLYLGAAIFLFAFMPVFMVKSYKTSENKLLALSKSCLIIAGVILLLALSPLRSVYDKGEYKSPNDQLEQVD